MNEDKITYNIDGLTLKMCCPSNVFNKLAFVPSEITEFRDGYEVTIIEKDSEYNPETIYLHISYGENKTIGVIKCIKHEQTAIFETDKEIFYTPFQNVDGKVSMVASLEYVLTDLGFDIQNIDVVNMRIVRDSLWNTLAEIEKMTEKPGYYPVIYSKESENCYLTDFYYFSEDGDGYKSTNKLRKKKACVLSNILGSLRLRIFCLTDLIKDLTNEAFINTYNNFPKDKDNKVYRSEISFNDYQLQQYFISKDMEYNGYFSWCQFFNSNNIKNLFNFLIMRILYFQEKGTNEIIRI